MKNLFKILLLLICITTLLISDISPGTSTGYAEPSSKKPDSSYEDTKPSKSKKDEFTDDDKDEESDKSDETKKTKKSESKKENSSKKSENNDDDKNKSNEYSIKSDKYLVIDLSYDSVLLAQNHKKKINPSGLTKILTAITVIENVKNINSKVTVPKDILKDYDYSYSNVGLASGNTMTYKEMIALMMMRDAGDCAVALAHLCEGSYDDFIKKMNETAKKAGATASHFSNPAGFEEASHYSTLNDLGAITKYALENETFFETASCTSIEIPSSKPGAKPLKYYNQNHYISTFYSLEYYNEHIVAGKDYRIDDDDTGLAVNYNNGTYNLLCLCAGSYKDDETNYAYKDINSLIDTIKNEFVSVSLVTKDDIITEVGLKNGEDADRVLLIASENVRNRLKKDYDPSKIQKNINLNEGIHAPIKKDDILGQIVVTYEGDEIGKTDLKAFSSVDGSIMNFLLYHFDIIISSVWFKIIFSISVVIFAIYIMHKIRVKNSRKKRPRLKTRK